MRISQLLPIAFGLFVTFSTAAPASAVDWDALIASSPGPEFALTNNFGTTDPEWIPFAAENVTARATDINARTLCNAPHVEMWSGGNCDGTEIRHLTMSNKNQCYYALTSPYQFTTFNIDGYNGATGTNYWQFFRGGSSNYCSSLLFSLVNWVGCVQFNDGFYYANGATWDCF